MADQDRVAWRIRLDDFDPLVVFAATAAKAKWIAVKGWREAGYGGRGQWPCTLTVRRSERHDNHPYKQIPDAAHNELYMEYRTWLTI